MPPKIAPLMVAIVLAACSRGEPETKRGPSASAPVPAPAAPSVPEEKAAAGAYAPSDALKERLARQEAASKLLDAPTPARAPEPAPKPLAAAKAPPPPAPPPASVKVEPPRAPPPVDVAAAPSPPPAPPKSEPAKPEGAPRTEVAVAKPAGAAPVTRLLHRVEPEFPREALKAGVNEGIVQARLAIDAGGNVTRVEVIEAKPRRLFDRAVTRALSEWKYSAGAADRTVEVEIAFSAR